MGDLVVTHWHYDHIGGVEAVLDHLGHSVNLRKHRRIPYDKVHAGAGEKMPSGADIPDLSEFEWNFLRDGEEIETEGAKMTTLFTPGAGFEKCATTFKSEISSMFLNQFQPRRRSHLPLDGGRAHPL